MRLDNYSTGQFSRGASWSKEALWVLLAGSAVASSLPGSGWRRALLKLFGARIGTGVVIKPRVRVKFPWRLEVGAHSWIGESVWIDSIETVAIGSHCCVSQGAYFCTGNHRWDKVTFDLVCAPIIVEDECWIGAYALIGPGTYIEKAAVLLMGTVASGRLEGRSVFAGNPVRRVKSRESYS